MTLAELAIQHMNSISDHSNYQRHVHDVATVQQHGSEDFLLLLDFIDIRVRSSTRKRKLHPCTLGNLAT